ncbi:hypothetical protein M3Y99_01100700 [Aphelenchoides fujianensis]|nr:hypothetical protein M3Y99_01100700 [Aphelenchoides fujianensis]
MDEIAADFEALVDRSFSVLQSAQTAGVRLSKLWTPIDLGENYGHVVSNRVLERMDFAAEFFAQRFGFAYPTDHSEEDLAVLFKHNEFQRVLCAWKEEVDSTDVRFLLTCQKRASISYAHLQDE